MLPLVFKKSRFAVSELAYISICTLRNNHKKLVDFRYADLHTLGICLFAISEWAKELADYYFADWNKTFPSLTLQFFSNYFGRFFWTFSTICIANMLFQKFTMTVLLKHSLKGQCHEIFCFWFFSWISFPPAPEYPIRTVSNFFKNSRRYS